MSTTDTSVPQVIVNKLTKQQYDSIVTKNPNEFYAITDALIDSIYPVGSIYMSATLSTAAAVGSALGGTWVAWGSGRVPVGVDTNDADFDTAEETGGEKTHTLTTTEMPSHNHTSKGWAAVTDGSGSYVTLGGSGSSTDYSTNNRGGGGAHNNLQPYITCYMYKRTA